MVERSIRPLALAGKNALFAGSDGGAEHWAAVASLIETCKFLGVEPQGYLTDAITPPSPASGTAARQSPTAGLPDQPAALKPWPETAAY